MDNLDTIKGLIEEVLKPIVSTAIKDAMPQHNADDELKYYTINEVCEMLHICRQTFYNYVRRNSLRPEKIEGRLMVSSKELTRAIKTRSIVKFKYRGKRD